MEPREMTMMQAATQMRHQRLTAEHLMRSYLNRLKSRDEQLKAWVNMNEDEAMEQAKALDEHSIRDNQWKGVLHGLPIGIKDIFEVKNMETRAGTQAYSPTIANEDALSVALLREAGAVIMGKTATTPFAMGDPASTTNPWNAEHTPGGSSVGSAVAVADGHCTAAIGTQTAGSVLRPASYNGVIGFKPTHGQVSTSGLIPVSWQLDHVGTFTRTVSDAHWMWNVLRTENKPEWVNASDGKLPDPLEPELPVRVWRVKEGVEEHADSEMKETLESCCTLLEREGVQVIDRPLPFAFDEMLNAHQCIMCSEVANLHHERFAFMEGQYPPSISKTIKEGLKMDVVSYLDALRYRQRIAGLLEQTMYDTGVILLPATPGAAPHGLSHTGPRSMNIMASLTGLPAVSIPVRFSSKRLPMSIQLIGHARQEDTLLSFAAACERLFKFQPGLPA